MVEASLLDPPVSTLVDTSEVLMMLQEALPSAGQLAQSCLTLRRQLSGKNWQQRKISAQVHWFMWKKADDGGVTCTTGPA